MAGERWLRVLLRWYPASFRERHGHELLAFWKRQAEEDRYAGRGGGLLWRWHVTRDAVAGGLRQRLTNPGGGVWRVGEAGRSGDRSAVFNDARYALRSIVGAPMYSLVVVVTLALGIGATTAIFAVVNTVVLQPLPYPVSSELVSVSRVEDGDYSNVSWLDYQDWRDRASGFSGLAAWCETGLDFRWADGAEQLRGAAVSRNLFDVLGVGPLIGRSFTEEEDRPGGTDAVILSWGVWQRRFGGDAGVLGRTVVISGEPVEVVGVMPRGFAYPNEETEYWQPLQGEEILESAGLPTGSRGLVFLEVVGRLSGSIDRAQTELSALATRIWDEAGIPPERRLPVRIVSLHERTVGDVTLTLIMLSGAVALVLLVACANVAGLALSRSAARSRELAVRVALGAARRRLIRQLMTESLLLAGVAGVAGIGVAWGLTRLIVRLAPGDVPRLGGAGVGPGMLGFAVAVTLVSGVLFGLLPALRSTRGEVTDGLARHGRSAVSDRRALRPQQLLATFQVSMSVALLAGAALLVRSYAHLMAVDTGYTTEGVTLAAVSPPEDRYVEPAVIDEFYAQLLERVRALPGVVAATTTYSPPLTGNEFSTTVEIEGQPLEDETRNWAGTVVVRDDYFETTGTPLLEGRDFDGSDRLGSEPVVIVNRAMAERFWPGEDAIGKRFRMTTGITGSMGQFDRRYFPRDWFTVIGVAGDVRRASLDQPPEPEYYRPHGQITWSFEYLVIRTAADVPGLGDQIRELVHSIDPTVPVESIRTVRSTVREATAEWRFRMLLLSAFGVTTCLLAMLGVYAVMALAVARRRREFGVRLALGATGAALLRQTLARGLGLVAAGVVTGLVIAMLASRVLKTMLYEVAPSDPGTYVAVIATTATVALIACWLPARRASRVDPVRSLQEE